MKTISPVCRKSATRSSGAQLRPAAKNRGFTLMEILVVLVILGMIFGLAVGQIGKMGSRNMKITARRLVSTIRYLYNKAASEGVTLRLVFNIDEGTYKVESTSGQFALAKEEKEVFEKSKRKKESESEASESGAKKEVALKPQEASFSGEESKLLKPVKLPAGVFIKDIFAEHQAGPVSSETAYIYFFPQGYAERSIINLRDRDDEKHLSLEVNPITGTVKIEDRYKELEEER